MKKFIFIITILLFFCKTANSLEAQIIPINHEMKNLKLGNTFIYHFQAFDTRGVTSVEDYYSFNKVIRYDTIANKAYAVFQNGVRERADSSGVYWIPLSYDNVNSG